MEHPTISQKTLFDFLVADNEDYQIRDPSPVKYRLEQRSLLHLLEVVNERPTLLVNKVQTLGNIEELVARVNSDQSDSNLLMAHSLKGARFGCRSSLLQFLITWAKRSPHGRLISYFDTEAYNQDNISTLVAQDYWLVAALLADDVVLRDGKTSILSEMYSSAYKQLLKMNSVEGTRRGDKYLLLCADHTSCAYIPLLYHQTRDLNKNLRSKNDFNILSLKLLNLVLRSKGGSVPFDDEFAGKLGAILYELFHNTHLWARNEWDKAPLRKSIRAISVQGINCETEDSQIYLEDSKALLDYVSHPILVNGQRQKFIEVSVLDSGPGLASHWLSSDLDKITIPDEYDAVLSCLTRRSTKRMPRRGGIGLDIVMQVLTQVKGFIRIRSGRLNLYRDMIRNPYDAGIPILYDWSSNSTELNQLPPVEGTLITMLVPLTSG